MPSALQAFDNHPFSFPVIPSTPAISSIPELNNDGDSFAASFARGSSVNHPNKHSDLDPYALPFVPSQAHFAEPPKLTHPHSAPRPRPIPSPPPLGHRSHFSCSVRSGHLTVTTTNAAKARLYSPHFPPQHMLDSDFVRKYAPGAEIGVGGYGFVVTAQNRLEGHEVAVKFIERCKVHPWGWSEDPVLGRVPTEAMLLRMLDHPGIIKFLDFFQDKDYFYLVKNYIYHQPPIKRGFFQVQELHGSPWRRRVPVYSDGPRHKVFSAPNMFKDASPFMYNVALEVSKLPEPYDPPEHPERVSCDISRHDSGFAVTPSLSSSSSSPLSSPASPVSPSMLPAVPLPNIGRRLSHDLFECIEEHQRLSESQARYIFAQVVDAIHYLDSVGVSHRDIKDENVLVDRAFRVKIIDFGSASCVDPGNSAPRPWYRHFRGTVAYAPAEILRHAKCHQAEPADVWALGVLLSYLITGRSAFPTAADAAQGKIILHKCAVRAEGEALSGTRKENSVSAQCGDLLQRCLDPDPNKRASIAEVKRHPWLNGALHRT